MVHEYDIISVTERDDVVVCCLPDGSSMEVAQVTIHRSATLQEAIHTSECGANVRITLPRGVLQDWLQSVEALKAAATSTGDSAGIAHNPHLLKFLRVCFFCFCSCERFLACHYNCGWQYSLLVLVQGQRVVLQHHASIGVFHASVVGTYVSMLCWSITVQML